MTLVVVIDHRRVNSVLVRQVLATETVAGPSLMVTVAWACALTAGGVAWPVLPNPLTVTASVNEPSNPVKLPVKLHRLGMVFPVRDVTVCGRAQLMLVAQVLP